MLQVGSAGALKDGYVHNVPLPRVPQIHGANPLSNRTDSQQPKAGIPFYLVTYMFPLDSHD